MGRSRVPIERRLWEKRMERSVEILVAIVIGVVGLSHLLQPKAWAEKAGAFVDGESGLAPGA